MSRCNECSGNGTIFLKGNWIHCMDCDGFGQISKENPTLRDQFAMAALTGFTSIPYDPDADDGEIEPMVRDCYAIADAMLEARKHK